MQTICQRTRLAPEHVAEYERTHAEIPEELDAALRRAGVVSWRIWRSGVDLIHVIDVEDFVSMGSILEVDAANIAWQFRINALLDPTAEPPAPLPLVWQLPAEAARAEP